MFLKILKKFLKKYFNLKFSMYNRNTKDKVWVCGAVGSAGDS